MEPKLDLIINLLLLFLTLVVLWQFISTKVYSINIKISKNKLFLKGDVKNYFKDKKVIITGLVRNSGNKLYNSILFLYGQVLPHFKDYEVLIYENDSKDKTREILLKQAQKDPKFKVMCGKELKYNLDKCEMNLKDTGMRNVSSTRINKMAMLRNMYVDEIKKDKYKNIEYVIVYDFDLNPTITVDSIQSTSSYFHEYKQVDAICANTMRKNEKYYDNYAYQPFGKTNKYSYNYMNKYKSGKNGLEKVNSCFNGLTIYRRLPFINSLYYTYKIKEDKTGVECEHVGFNNNLNIYTNNEFIMIIDDDFRKKKYPSNNDPYDTDPYDTDPYDTDPYDIDPYDTDRYNTDSYN